MSGEAIPKPGTRLILRFADCSYFPDPAIPVLLGLLARLGGLTTSSSPAPKLVGAPHEGWEECFEPLLLPSSGRGAPDIPELTALCLKGAIVGVSN